MASARRQQLVETALELFSREGFHATGIDRILAVSGVAKRTLYHHFRSKDELILAALRLRDERFRDDFIARAERLGASGAAGAEAPVDPGGRADPLGRADRADPAGRAGGADPAGPAGPVRSAAVLLALFDVLAGHADDADFCGCAFINACAEFSDPASPVRALACEHKGLIQEWMCEHARNAGARDPEVLARQLLLLMDGAIVRAQVAGGSEGAAEAREAARALMGLQGVEVPISL